MTALARHTPVAPGRDCVAMRDEHLAATPPCCRGVTERAIAGKGDDEVRALVRALHAARKSSRAARAQTYGANKAAPVIRQVCPSCSGSGQDPGIDETCATCAGSGWEPHAD